MANRRQRRPAKSLDVSRGGTHDRALTATWSEHIEELLPLEISSLFFFDGEKIESLADPDQASSVIAAAVTGLLGLGVIERLQRDLLVIEKRKQDEVLDSLDDLKMKGLSEAETKAEYALSGLMKKKAVEQNHLDRVTKDLSGVEQLARNEGGDLFERRLELERTLSEAQRDLSSSNAALKELAAGVLPLALCTDLVRSIANDDLAADPVDPVILTSLLADHDTSVVEQLKTFLNENDLKTVSSLLEVDRQQRADQLRSDPASARTSITSIRAARAALEQLGDRTGDLIQALGDRSEALDLIADLERELAGVPSEAAITQILTERDRLRLKRAEIVGRIDLLAEEAVLYERQLQSAQTEHQAARQHAALSTLRGKDGARILEHAQKVRSTLEQLKSEVRQRSIAKIETEVLRCYRKLLGKQGLVVGLSLDSETCVPLLTTTNDEQVHLERLSAGERQLFAVAMLWGLALVAGPHPPNDYRHSPRQIGQHSQISTSGQIFSSCCAAGDSLVH